MMPTDQLDSANGYDLPVFASRRAPELDGTRKRYSVAVVGAGLAGLTVACDLALRGVDVVLLDEDDTVGARGASSRGICYAQKSLEIFERLGIYDRIAAKGATWSVGRVLRNNDELYQFELARGSACQQPPFINIQQFYVEWFLVERLAELDIADLRWRNAVVGVRPMAHRVELDVETPDGSYTLEADWVVDCSGIASRLRAELGLKPDVQFDADRWCISDVRFAHPVASERWTWVEAPFNEGRAVWQHKMADGVWRIDYQMPPDSDPAEIGRPEIVRARLEAQLGHTGFEVVWVGPYSYRTQLLDCFRHGRILFAGDAAHVFSPFGARGGNSGIQDAENLAWKLTAVVRGHAPEALLDSYDAERRAAAVHNIRVTGRTTRFLAPRSAFERALRWAVLDLARDHEFARAFVNAGRMSQPYDYSHSTLTTNAASAVPNVAVRYADGTWGSLSEVLAGEGARCLVLCFPDIEAPRLCNTIAQVWAVGGEVGDLPILRGDELEALGIAGEVFVVRPDQHLAARLMRPTREMVEAAIDKAFARKPA